MSEQRQRTIIRHGSPRYQYSLAAIVAGASYTFAPDQYWPASKKYSPLDTIEISNLDPTCDLNVILNAKSRYVVPSSSTRVITDQAIRQIRIENRHAVTATTVNLVIISCERAPMSADMGARV